ncbi:hypothetical protein SISNIDRAFT_547037 [Sistotremastrum niveocremeum HHB9708]|uniref:RING-type domain-containing protein n=2 Tax=Sistotremastraceae TaxID=3402574 RepID=A0A164ZSS8_9AGAM|nr:hypothetical protein SISNIDRAFT_547037 [Sistotremastrum niveocremeum HHB9708]KZT38363.1 hypothetical protein SISSUDRAFT_1128908 [Sistotremastrum suecicum HHB10207 ss-3]
MLHGLTGEQARVFNSLPKLSRADLGDNESCPICLIDFSDILDETEASETALGCEETASFIQGVTKLEGCGHIFCRQDLHVWIQTNHGSCPTCRHVFLEIEVVEDDESSDGGEYMPSSDFEFTEEITLDLDLTSDEEDDDDIDVEHPRSEDGFRSEGLPDDFEDNLMDGSCFDDGWTDEDMDLDELEGNEDREDGGLDDMDGPALDEHEVNL